MCYIVIQNQHAFEFIFDSLRAFRDFCDEWQILSEYDIMIIEINFIEKTCRVVWKVNEGWL